MGQVKPKLVPGMRMHVATAIELVKQSNSCSTWEELHKKVNTRWSLKTIKELPKHGFDCTPKLKPGQSASFLTSQLATDEDGRQASNLEDYFKPAKIAIQNNKQIVETSPVATDKPYDQDVGEPYPIEVDPTESAAQSNETWVAPKASVKLEETSSQLSRPLEPHTQEEKERWIAEQTVQPYPEPPPDVSPTSAKLKNIHKKVAEHLVNEENVLKWYKAGDRLKKIVTPVGLTMAGMFVAGATLTATPFIGPLVGILSVGNVAHVAGVMLLGKCAKNKLLGKTSSNQRMKKKAERDKDYEIRSREVSEFWEKCLQTITGEQTKKNLQQQPVEESSREQQGRPIQDIVSDLKDRRQANDNERLNRLERTLESLLETPPLNQNSGQPSGTSVADVSQTNDMKTVASESENKQQVGNVA